MLREAYTKKHYETVVLMTIWNIKKKDSEGQTWNEEKRKTRSKIIWFSPPVSFSVKTNIWKLFFKMLKKRFSKSNLLSKIFNKNTIKISFSRTRNMKLIISSYNKQILTLRNKEVGCNCRVTNCCPLDNKCQTSQLIYQADVTNSLDDEHKYYQGLAEKTFK